jgi:hypothetical protein
MRPLADRRGGQVALWPNSVRLDQASRKTDAKWRIIIMMGATIDR